MHMASVIQSSYNDTRNPFSGSFRYFNKSLALLHSWDTSGDPWKRYAEIGMYCMEKKYLRSLNIDIHKGARSKMKHWMGDCDLSPDRYVLATSWMNGMTRLIDTDHNSIISERDEKTGKVLFSPSGRLLARSTTNGIQRYAPNNRRFVRQNNGILSRRKVSAYSYSKRFVYTILKQRRLRYSAATVMKSDQLPFHPMGRYLFLVLTTKLFAWNQLRTVQL